MRLGEHVTAGPMSSDDGDRPRSERLQERVADDWVRALLVVAVGVPAVATAVRFAASPFHVNRDSALFQHAGWYLGEGARLYVEVWDLKPPLIYAVTRVLAAVSGDDMALLHVLGVAVSVAAVAGGVALIGLTVHRLTGDGFAAVVAAGSAFALTSLYAFPYAGIRPKYFAFLCAAAALYLAIADRHGASGVAAALGAGFWQIGGGVALLVVAMAHERAGMRAAARTVAGGVAVAVLTVLPFAATGRAVPLFVEVVVAPVYGVENYTVPGRLLALVVELGPGLLLAPLAAYGWWRGVRSAWRRYWWVAAGGCLYSLQVLLEFQGAIEFVLPFLFYALGVGVLVAEAPTPARRSRVAVAVAALVAAALYWQGGPVTPVKDLAVDLQAQFSVPTYEVLPPDPAGVPSMRTIYWERLEPGICHYRLGHKQKHFEAVTDGTLLKERCGQWPFERPPAAWVADRLGLPWP